MCLNETYSRVRVGKNLSDMFPLKNGSKQGDVLPLGLFNFALEYAIRTVQVNQDGLKLHDTLQLIGYVYDVNTLGGRVHTTQKNTGDLVVDSNENGAEVNASVTKYKGVSRDRNEDEITI